MIDISNVEVFGWEAAIRGMRNPLNSWDKSDSEYMLEFDPDENNYPILSSGRYVTNVGENDLKLMKNLSKAGTDHSKYLRMINVTFDMNAPLYFWKEFDTYKVGTVANSCSTMHKIQAKEFTLEDFSIEHLVGKSVSALKTVIDVMNLEREHYINSGDKDCWWQMIQLLPSSYNQKRTLQVNYQVLKNMYYSRKNHKLDEWHAFCDWCLSLPYFKELCVFEE